MLGRVGEHLAESGLRALVEHLRCVHLVLPTAVGRYNLDDTAQIVNTQYSGAA
jgi:hypothetical protein